MITIHTKCDGCDYVVLLARAKAGALEDAADYLREYARLFHGYKAPAENPDLDYCPACWERMQAAKDGKK